MRAGWSEHLKDAVQRGDSACGPIAEVVVLADSDVRSTRDQWNASTLTNVAVQSGGGVALSSSSTTRVSYTTATDPTDITRLTNGDPFDGILIEWYGSGAWNREFRNLTARLHPRLDAGQPKTVAYWVCEIFRVTQLDDEDIRVELLKRRRIDATGDVEADFTFNFGGYNGGYPRVGQPPEGSGTGRPMTVIRIVALRSDGTIADNVSWAGSSTNGDSTSGAGVYLLHHYTFNDLPSTSGVTSWFFQGDRSDLPRFTLNEPTYANGDAEFTGANDFDDLTGSGSTVVVLRGTQPSDTEIRGFIWDGTAYVRCYDGDIVGEDNQVTIGGTTFGGDLSGVPTTGPWNMRVYLDTSSDALSTPIVKDFGLERVERTLLTGAARVSEGAYRISDLTALKGNIAAASIEIAKAGEKDYDDYGSRILATKHIGKMEVRLWIGDLTGTELARTEWMLHSIWEIESYVNMAASHRLRVVSPLRRLRRLIPPFVVTGGGPDGTRTAVEYSDDLFAVWSDIMDTMLALPARYIGTGPSDETTVIGKTIRKADGKDELDAVSYLDGGVNIESQGRVKHVRILHDDPADEPPVFRLPIGSYTPVEVGPGFDARTDEFFVKYNYSEASQGFEDERRHFNAAALDNLGGSGLNTTQELRDEVAQWIRTSALADAVGRRVVNHFGTGEILWHVRPADRMPHLEIGDVGIIETDLFVARTPITERELRGPLATLCIVVGVDDVEGRGLWLWVPSYELMTVIEATSTQSGFAVPEVSDLTYSFNASDELVVSLRADGAGSVRVAAGATRPSDATVDAATPQNVDADGLVEVNMGSGYPTDTTVAARAYALTGGTGPSSDVTVSNVFKVTYIEADGGDIGGWTLSSTDLSAGGATGLRIESDTRRILMGAATAPTTGVGIFLGLDGADWEFRAGNPAGDNLHWDGTDLTITGAITADTGEIGGWDITATDIIAGSGSARVTLESDTQRIMIGAATAPLVGTGVFLGLSGGVYQFRAGDPAGDYMLYDGTTIVLGGEIITAANIPGNELDGSHISALSFSGKTATFDTGSIGGWLMSASTLHSAVSGNRITIDATNETITIGAATAPLTGAGVFMGSDGATGYDFRAGDPAGEYIHFDASAGTFEIKAESFTAANPVFDGSVSIEAGAGAQRIHLGAVTDGGEIELYNATATLVGELRSLDNGTPSLAGILLESVMPGGLTLRASGSGSLLLDSASHIAVNQGSGSSRAFTLHKDMTTRTDGGVGKVVLETITVPANALGANGGVRFRAWGTTDGLNATRTIYVAWDGTEEWSYPIVAANRGFWSLEVDIHNAASTTAQRMGLRFTFANGSNGRTQSFTGLAANTGTDTDLELKVNIANAGDSFSVYGTTVEYVTS